MKKCLLAVGILFCSSFSFAQNSSSQNFPEISTSSESISKFPSRSKTKYSGKISLITTQSHRSTGYRNLKTTGADEGPGAGSSGGSGSGSERSSTASLSYLAGSGTILWTEKTHSSLIVLKSLSDQNERSFATPSGRRIVLPGQMINLRLSHYLTPTVSLGFMANHVDTHKYGDPSTSLSYNTMNPLGWNYRSSLSASIPATSSSYKDDLITKGSLRLGTNYRAIVWSAFANISYNESFYQDKSKIGSRRSTTASSNPAPANREQRPVLQQIDVLLSEVELKRYSGSTGYHYNVSEKFRLSTALGLAQIETLKGNQLWLTTLKPFGVLYKDGSLEASSDIFLYSNVAKYKSPSFPENLNISLNLSYAFGNNSRTN